MQQYMTGEQVARVVTLPVNGWVNYDEDYIQGEFDFEVRGGSTEPRNESFRRQAALQLADISFPFVEMGVRRSGGALPEVARDGFGEKDAQRFIAKQASRTGHPTTRSRRRRGHRRPSSSNAEHGWTAAWTAPGPPPGMGGSDLPAWDRRPGRSLHPAGDPRHAATGDSAGDHGRKIPPEMVEQILQEISAWPQQVSRATHDVIHLDGRVICPR